MGVNKVSFADELTISWLELAKDLLSQKYRESMSLLTGYDLTEIPFEVNLYHYDDGAYLGPHIDLPEKLVVHVLYFNESWQSDFGGCLSILNSPDANDIAAEVLPLVGSSVVFVRSDHSWHEVKRVKNKTTESRRSLVVTFYKPGSISTMWPPGDAPSLHRYKRLDV
jgi:Rps23 Pro-64 3,4-dihydroxylase Tpa1-like proline 4-hydroxylase